MLHQRLMVVGGMLAVLAVLPLWKLVGVQLRDGAALVERGEHQRVRTVELSAHRGSILDRNGVELAISLPRRRVAVNMGVLTDEGVEDVAALQQFATTLAGLLGVDAAGVTETLLAADRDDPWVRVAELVDIETAERAVRAIHDQGIEYAIVLEDSSERVHPTAESALRVIGNLGVDGPAENAGIERAFDAELSGRPGEKVVEIGGKGQTIAGSERVVEEPVAGADVMLTLDRTLQFEVEKIVADGVDRAQAARGTAIVGRPGSGEILAVASVDRDPETGELSLSDSPVAFASSYQAGSVFKLVTVASAIEHGLVDGSTVFEVPDQIEVDDRVFSDHEPHPTEPMTVTRILAESSNVGTITIAQQLGKERLHSALRDFGFGSLTGVSHPAESAGILPPVTQWTNPDLAASAIGTHQAATAVQLWSAYNVIANQGRFVQPRLVDSVIGADGRRRPVETTEPRRVISEEAAAQVGAMLQEVVRDGTGSQWNLPGYSVAAKTGTSRMVSDTGFDATDGYLWADQRFHYLAAFTGYLPADRPEVSITVILEDIAPGLTGSTAAGPVFSGLSRLAIRELGIAPSRLVDSTTLGAEDAGTSVLGPVRADPAAAPVVEDGATNARRERRTRP